MAMLEIEYAACSAASSNNLCSAFEKLCVDLARSEQGHETQCEEIGNFVEHVFEAFEYDTTDDSSTPRASIKLVLAYSATQPLFLRLSRSVLSI